MINNEITIQDLLKGKETIIKNKEFLATKSYIEPFLERMSKFTSDFRIKAVTPDQITRTKSAEDITYNRVLIEAVLPEKNSIDRHDEVIAFLYGIDVKRPVAKLYRGYLNQACTNLTVFNPNWLNIQEIIPGDSLDFSSIENLLSIQNDFSTIISKMKSTYIDRNARKNYLGEWVDYSLRENEDYGFGKVKIAVSTPIDAYKSLFIDNDSSYYIPEGIDPSLFDVHNAFTQIITDDKRDILNKFEKTMIINRLLRI